MANLFWISAAQVAKDLGDGPYSAATLLARYGWTFSRADSATCATYIDKNGIVQTAAANLLRLQYEDLNGDGIRETPGFSLEGSGTNLVIRSRTFTDAAWVKDGAPITAGQTDDFGGTGASQLDQLDAATLGRIHQVVTFTGNGTKAFALLVRAGTATQSMFGLWDNTASTWRNKIRITWSAGVPSLSVLTGAGDLFPVKALAGGWYIIAANATGVVAANANWYFIGDDAATQTGTMFIDQAQAENAVFPSSMIVTAASTVTRAADSLTVPFVFGPQDCTVYARVARPVHADAAGTLTASGDLNLFSVSDSGASAIECRFSATSRILQTIVRGASGFSIASSASIPAGTPITVVSQFKNLTTTPAAAIDVGTGLTAFATGATAFTAFGNQTLRVADRQSGNPLYGVLLDLKARAGLITLAAIQTEPSFAPTNPLEVTDFEVPGPLISKAQSGRVNTRGTQQIGRTWTERYLLRVSDTTSKEFLARMSTYWRNGTIFAHGHVDYAACKGVGGGVPLVNGASQTGSTLIVDQCPASTAGWLLAGDIFRVQGLPQVLMCAADVNTEGSGRALIPLVTPIFTGGSPADNASLTITGVTLDVVILEPPSFPTSSGHSADFGELVLKFSESL